MVLVLVRYVVFVRNYAPFHQNSSIQVLDLYIVGSFYYTCMV
jgi:hypothetical protein